MVWTGICHGLTTENPPLKGKRPLQEAIGSSLKPGRTIDKQRLSILRKKCGKFRSLLPLPGSSPIDCSRGKRSKIEYIVFISIVIKSGSRSITQKNWKPLLTNRMLSQKIDFFFQFIMFFLKKQSYRTIDSAEDSKKRHITHENIWDVNLKKVFHYIIYIQTTTWLVRLHRLFRESAVET